ncbi:MAG: hypothetical protein ACOX4F_06950 [Atopobiaceae bacterium]
MSGETKNRKHPEIVKASLIDDRRIELYWSTQVKHADDEKYFSVTMDGKELALFHWTREMPWNYGTCYRKEMQCTTLALVDPVDTDRASDIQVRVTREVHDLDDNPADYERTYQLAYNPHYTSFLRSKSGILIKGSKVIQPYSLNIAASIVDIMLEKRPEIAQKLIERGCEIAVYGLLYDAYDVPEHRMGYWVATRPVAGFGGDDEVPTTSISEANLIRLRSGRYATAYPHEMVLVHEFGHAVHLVGINFLDDQTLAQQVRDTYKHALDTGLWHDSYAISNYEEYFATLSTIWFDVMQEGVDGKWDGIRGPVNTRDELEEYDPQGYELMAAVYPEKRLPRPWRWNKDNYDISGKPRSYDLDTKFNWDFIGR